MPNHIESMIDTLDSKDEDPLFELIFGITKEEFKQLKENPIEPQSELRPQTRKNTIRSSLLGEPQNKPIKYKWLVVLFIIKHKLPLIRIEEWAGTSNKYKKNFKADAEEVRKALFAIGKTIPDLNEVANSEKSYAGAKKKYDKFIESFPPELQDKAKELLPRWDGLKKTNSKGNKNKKKEEALSSTPITPVTPSTPGSKLKDDEEDEKTASPTKVAISNKSSYLFLVKNLNVMHEHKPRDFDGKQEQPMTFVEGNELHERLRKHTEKIRYYYQAKGKKSDGEKNIIVATICFVVSKKALDERVTKDDYGSVVISIDISDDLNFERSINTHEDGFVKNALLKNNPLKLESPLNPSSDHHSELALYAYLSRVKTCKWLIAQLKAKHANRRGYRVYSMTLDIHSTNSICKDCLPLTVGMYTEDESPHNFLANLRIELGNAGFVVESPKKKIKKLSLIVRYSYQDFFKDGKPSNTYTTDSNEIWDHQLKSIRQLHDSKAVLHQKYTKKALEPLEKKRRLMERPPRFTLFFSGSSNSVHEPVLALNRIAENEYLDKGKKDKFVKLWDQLDESDRSVETIDKIIAYHHKHVKKGRSSSSTDTSTKTFLEDLKLKLVLKQGTYPLSPAAPATPSSHLAGDSPLLNRSLSLSAGSDEAEEVEDVCTPTPSLSCRDKEERE